MSFKEDIWKKLILSTLFSKFRHIPPWFLGAQKLIVIKDHLKKRIKQFPACNDFFLIWDIFCSHFDWAIYSLIHSNRPPNPNFYLIGRLRKILSKRFQRNSYSVFSVNFLMRIFFPLSNAILYKYNSKIKVRSFINLLHNIICIIQNIQMAIIYLN